MINDPTLEKRKVSESEKNLSGEVLDASNNVYGSTFTKGVPVTPNKKDEETHKEAQRKEDRKKFLNDFGKQVEKLNQSIGDIYIEVRIYTSEVEYENLGNILKNQPEEFINHQNDKYIKLEQIKEEIEKFRIEILQKLEIIEDKLRKNTIDLLRKQMSEPVDDRNVTANILNSIQELMDETEKCRDHIKSKLLSRSSLKIFTGIISREVFNNISSILETQKSTWDDLTNEYKELQNQLNELEQHKNQIGDETESQPELDEIERQEQDIKNRMNKIENEKNGINKSRIKKTTNKKTLWSNEHYFTRSDASKILVNPSFRYFLEETQAFEFIIHELIGTIIYVTPFENGMIDSVYNALKKNLNKDPDVRALYDEVLSLKEEKLQEFKISRPNMENKDILQNFKLELIQITRTQWEILTNENNRYILEDRWNLLEKMKEEIDNYGIDIGAITDAIDKIEPP